jgi:prepilin-type N-terminal cleavage/methylation domain-containing protein
MKTITDKGFTLLEIMLAVAVFTVLCGGLTGALLAGRSAWKVNENSSTVQHQARNVISVMTDDLRQASHLKIDSNDHSVHFSFTHPKDGKVSYAWDKTTQQVTRTAKVISSAQTVQTVQTAKTAQIAGSGVSNTGGSAAEPVSGSANNASAAQTVSGGVSSTGGSAAGPVSGAANNGSATQTASGGVSNTGGSATEPVSGAADNASAAQTADSGGTDAGENATEPPSQVVEEDTRVVGTNVTDLSVTEVVPPAAGPATEPAAEPAVQVEVTVASTSENNQTDTITLTETVVSRNTDDTEEPASQGDSTPPPVQGGSTPPVVPSGSIVTHGIAIPAGHPRLWWNAERLAQAQAWYAAHPFTASGTLENAWKHVVTGSSCASAITWAMNFQIPYPPYNGSSSADQARWNGENAIIVYDWCYDEMTSQQRADFLNNIASSGKGWNDYFIGLNAYPGGQPPKVDGNYTWGQTRNNIEYGIATYTENTTFAETVLDNGINTRWTQYFIPASSASLAGGVPGEGISYGAMPIAYMIIPAQTMTLLGRDILSETDLYKEYVYFILYNTTPTVTHHTNTANPRYLMNPFGDNEYETGGILYTRTYYQDYMNLASNYFSSVNVGKDARQWWNTVNADSNTKATDEYILAQDATPSARATSSLPLDYYSRKYLFGRKAWDTTSAYFLWQMGKGTGHEHQDCGNFNIWRGGRWLTRETAAYGAYITEYGGTGKASAGNGSGTGSVAHNIIMFGTRLYDLNNWFPTTALGNAVVNRLEIATGYVYADTDMTNLYLWATDRSSRNTGAAVHAEREYLFLRNLETTVILDRLTTGNVIRGVDTGVPAANEVNTFLLHSEVDPTLEDATHITIANGTQVLRMTTLVPANPTRRVVNEQSCSGCSAGIGQYRIELDTSGAAQRYFLNVLQARASNGQNITASVVDSAPADPLTGTFTVTLHPATGANTVIVFNKGQTSVGGTVNIAGAGVTSLRSGVQTISYTDNGPVWLNATCGDASCSGGETCSSCAADCGACPSCGDAACNGSETCVTCAADCGGC